MENKSQFQLKYEKEIVPKMMAAFGLQNRMAVPRFRKIVLNIGLKASLKDPKFTEQAEKTLQRITGQKPVKTLAKKSISNFKIRQGMVVGTMVTLRGHRMYDFLDKLINVTLPRIRDFRGLSPTSIDARGNMSIGFKEYIAFPEIRPDEIEKLHGLEIVIVTDAQDRAKGLALLKAAGMPFREGK